MECTGSCSCCPQQSPCCGPRGGEAPLSWKPSVHFHTKEGPKVMHQVLLNLPPCMRQTACSYDDEPILLVSGAGGPCLDPL